MAPSILGLAVTQLNVIINTLLASYLPEGSVSFLYYADRLLEFPMGIFAIAIATAVLPPLSEQAGPGEARRCEGDPFLRPSSDLLGDPSRHVGVDRPPHPGPECSFPEGGIHGPSTEMTSQALLYYTLGLVAFAGVRIIVPVFYALQDTRTPVKVAFLSLVANAGLGPSLMSP